MSWTAQQIRNRLSETPGMELPDFGRKASAVLLALVERPEGLSVLLTRRSADLPDHPGEISLPGGRVEAGEDSLEAALREGHEEIGLEPGQCDTLGRLDDSHTITGYRISPYVVLVRQESPFRLQTGEVEELLEVPLDRLLRWGGGFPVRIAMGKERGSFPILPVPGGLVWGATARILSEFVFRLSEPRPGDSLESRLAAVLRVCVGAERVLLTTHVNPDADAVGSVTALEEFFLALGAQVQVALDRPIPDEVAFLSPRSNVCSGSDLAQLAIDDFDLLVVADTADARRIGAVSPIAAAMADRTVVLDHHLSGDLQAIETLRDPSFSSASELVYLLLRRSGFRFTKRAADALYAGILSDTNGFRYVGNRSSAFEAGGHLVDLGADATAIQEALFSQVTPGHMAVMALCQTRVQYEFSGRLAWSFVTLQDLQDLQATPEDASEVAPALLSVRGVEVAAFFRETAPGAYKLSMRSVDAVRIVDICQSLGGGGHANAAGAVVSGGIEATMAAIREGLTQRWKGVALP